MASDPVTIAGHDHWSRSLVDGRHVELVVPGPGRGREVVEALELPTIGVVSSARNDEVLALFIECLDNE